MSDLAELFLSGLKQSATQPNVLGYKPHPAQEAFHRSTHLGRLFIGGNRSGKTVAGAVETVYRLRGEHPYQRVHQAPVRARGTAVDIEQGLNKIMLPELQRWIPPSLLINGSWEDSYHKQGRVLTCSNGSTMDFLTNEMDTDKHAGTSRHFQWFDEEPPQHIFNEDLLRLADVKGKWIMTMTPVEGMTWVYYDMYAPVIEEQDPEVCREICIIQVSTVENPYVSAEYMDALTRGMSEEEKTARRHGKFIAASGLIYPDFNESVHVIDPIDFSKVRNYENLTGMDHGLRNPTCWLWALIDAERRIIIYNEYYQAERTVGEHSKTVLDFEGTFNISPGYRVADPAIAQRSAKGEGGSIQTEYAEHGVFLGLGNNDVNYGLNRVRFLLQNNGLFITRNCVHTIKEFRNYRWDTWASKKSAQDKEAKDKPKKVKDHAMDTIRYIVCSRPEDEFIGPAGEIYLPFRTSTQHSGGPVTYNDYYPDDDIYNEYHQILGEDW